MVVQWLWCSAAHPKDVHMILAAAVAFLVEAPGSRNFQGPQL